MRSSGGTLTAAVTAGIGVDRAGAPRVPFTPRPNESLGSPPCLHMTHQQLSRMSCHGFQKIECLRNGASVGGEEPGRVKR